MEFVAPEELDEGAVMASTTHGVIQSINLADRTAQISGSSGSHRPGLRRDGQNVKSFLCEPSAA